MCIAVSLTPALVVDSESSFGVFIPDGAFVWWRCRGTRVGMLNVRISPLSTTPRLAGRGAGPNILSRLVFRVMVMVMVMATTILILGLIPVHILILVSFLFLTL